MFIQRGGHLAAIQQIYGGFLNMTLSDCPITYV